MLNASGMILGRSYMIVADLSKTISTGERPFLDILQDRRYWIIHLVTIPSLFIGEVYSLYQVSSIMYLEQYLLITTSTMTTIQ